MVMCRMVAFIVLILISNYLVTSVIPKSVDLVVLAGESIILSCTGKSLNWMFTYADGSYKDIYIPGLQLPFRRNDFSIHVNESSLEANLFIKSVSGDMAGVYSCGEFGSDFKDYESHRLIVLENVPVCHVTSVSDDRSVGLLTPEKIRPNECSKWSSYSSSQTDSRRTPTSELSQHEFIGPNTCGIPPDEISLTCGVAYFGPVAPDFELRNLGENTVVKCSETTSENTSSLTCQVTMEATKRLAEVQFVWKTTQSAHTQYSYTTERLKIMYSADGNLSNHTAAQVGDKVSCTASCSHPISYKWSWFETPGQGGYKCTRELEVTHAGLYTCEVMCQMGKQLCAVTAMQVEVSSSSATERVFGEKATTDLKTIVSITIGCLVVAGIIAAPVLIHVLLKRRRNRLQNHTENQTTEDATQTQTQRPLLQEIQESHC